MAQEHEAVDEMRADETSTASYQNSLAHRRWKKLYRRKARESSI